MGLQKMKIYTGIGAKLTPVDVLAKMEHYGEILARLGYVLRSGAAPGADSAFESGCNRANGLKEIFLPYAGFNDSDSELYLISEQVFDAASEYGPDWIQLDIDQKQKQARNVQQVMGQNLNELTHFVICWTEDGCNTYQTRTKNTGGTGQAIECASRQNVRVYNIRNDQDEKDLNAFISTQSSQEAKHPS